MVLEELTEVFAGGSETASAWGKTAFGVLVVAIGMALFGDAMGWWFLQLPVFPLAVIFFGLIFLAMMK